MQSLMTNANATNAYKRQGILTASPMELIVMLYDGLKKDLMLARMSIEKQDNEAAHKKLMNAQDIVTELMNSLNMNVEMSEDLIQLYDYMLRTLEEINMKKDAELIGPLLEIVSTMRDTWQEASASLKGTAQPGAKSVAGLRG